VKLRLARLSHLDVNEQQQRKIDWLLEENQTLRDCLKATGKRILLTDFNHDRHEKVRKFY